ncbi:alpha/beta fold hydrolase [Mycobacterium sp.]|uniref:alpha/beta fold hydrolase n=1 Tax=Mycobacterium sp. TaxID=1785 RepID=UPI003F9D7DDB
MNRRAAAGAALFGLVSWGGARALVARIDRNPDPFTRERLMAEPQGEEILISRSDGTLLRALVAGQGPPVIFVHGYTATIAEWNFVWDELVAKGFRVIAFDQRGHGGSTLGSDGVGSEPMATDVAAVLRHFDIRDGVLVGHSMGGFVTIRAMIDHPDLAGARPSPAMISVFIEGFKQHLDDHGPLVPIVRAFSREDRYPRLGEIAVPTVVMVGSADRTTPPSHSRRLASGIPGARLVTVPDAGHLLNWEGADELVDVIESFPVQSDSE